MCKKEYAPLADLEKQANSGVTVGLKVSKM